MSASTPERRVARALDQSRESRDWPRWVQAVRQVIIFLLGVVAIIYAMVRPQRNWGYIVAGMFLIGLIPIENLIERIPRQTQAIQGLQDQLDHLQQDPAQS